MKQVLITKLSYEGFYGQRRVVEFSPAETIIRGGNKLGKTTIINAFLWCLVGADIEARSNYMLYDQSVDFSRDFPGMARVAVEFLVDGAPMTFARMARQKWERNKSDDEYVKTKTDDYKYSVNDVECSAGEYKEQLERVFAPQKQLALIANVQQWRKLGWRTLREQFQTMVGQIGVADFSRDYSEITEMISMFGVERARTQLNGEATRNENELKRLEERERLCNDELAEKGGDTIDASEERSIEVQQEIDRLQMQQIQIERSNKTLSGARERIAAEISAKERVLRTERDAYNDAHNERMFKLKEEYRQAVSFNSNYEIERASTARQAVNARKQVELLELQRDTLRRQYKEINAQIYDGVCPTCGARIEGKAATDAIRSFATKKDMALMQIKSQGDEVNKQLRQWKTEATQAEQRLAEMGRKDEDALLEAYRQADESFVAFEDTERCRELQAEIDELVKEQPPMTWADEMQEILQRKGALYVEQQELAERLAHKAGVKRILARLDAISDERKEAVARQMQTAKKQKMLADYERELADIVRFRVNKLFPGRSEVVMTKVKKNGEIDYDVCQIMINGKDAAATNTADRMNADIDVSTVFMRHADLNFPLFVDGAESNTEICSYGRQVIKTIVDKDCKELTIERHD